jgi:hypothetical protein
MTINKLIERLQKYDGELEVSTTKILPTSADFVDSDLMARFGLELASEPAAEIVGSILELDLVVLK